MVEIEDAISYPMQSDNWVVTVLIGGALGLFFWLLVPIFILQGYYANVIRTKLAGETEPPSFGDWGQLLIDGLKLFVIGIVYMLVPVLIGGVLAVVGALLGSASEALGFLMFLLAFFVYLVLALAFGYFASVGIVNFVHEDDLSAAFDIGTIKSVGLTKAYAIPWLVGIAIVFGISFVVGMVGIIPILGFIIIIFVTPFTNFFSYMIVFSLWAEGFMEAKGMATNGPADSEPTGTSQPTGADF